MKHLYTARWWSYYWVPTATPTLWTRWVLHRAGTVAGPLCVLCAELGWARLTTVGDEEALVTINRAIKIENRIQLNHYFFD